MAFTDDFSWTVFVYFLRNKTDTLFATEKSLAHSAPFGQVKFLTSDNGSELTNKDFQSFIRAKII